MKKYYISLTLLLLMVLSSNAQIKRVEPPFWWADMKNPNLQLLIYGDNISGSKVEIDYPGVSVQSVSSLESPDYLFVDLYIEAGTAAGTFILNLSREGKPVASANYSLKERKKNSANRKGFDNSDVMYLLMPDRFANGDPSNDIVESMRETELDRSEPYGRHGGDIKGIISNLDYLADMGFTALWLNPVLENDMPESSYHGYAITDFYAVDQRFGTMDDYVRLSEMASEKGIKLVIDLVFNHCGSKHWWMENLPSSDWINFYPDYKVTNHRRTVNQDPYAAEKDKELMRDGWFVPSMPDLNLRNPFLKEYLIQNSVWLTEHLDLGGIRMDTYPYPDKDAMAEWCERLMDEYPSFNIVGEEWSTHPIITSYWQKGKHNYDGYQGNLPCMMDFSLQNAVAEGLKEKEEWGKGLVKIYESLSFDHVFPDPYNMLIFPDNHDMPRMFMQLDMDTKLYKQAVTFFLTTRGIPQFLYGSEILMSHTEGDGHGYIRKDFPGGWEGDEVNAFTGKGMKKDALEMQKFFKKMLNWRKENPVIHSGKLTHYAPQDGVYVYFRHNGNDRVMVIINKNTKNYQLQLGRFQEHIQGSPEALEVISNKKLILGKELLLKPKTSYVLELL